MSSKEVKVSSLPKCQFCNERAKYDIKTLMGPWAYVCQHHFDAYGIGLGVGMGLRLILVESKPVKTSAGLPFTGEICICGEMDGLELWWCPIHGLRGMEQENE